MQSATGHTALRRRGSKNPLKLAAGKRSGASSNHISKAIKQVRSSHLGYDCYTTGPVNGSGKIRCTLRAGRLPPHITNDVRVILPVEMWWPERDHKMAHHLIDSVLTFDLSTLRSLKESWPDHEFGVEQFMRLADRRMAAVRDGALPDVHRPPVRLDGAASPGRSATVSVQGGAPLPRQLALFPGAPTSRELISRASFGRYRVRIHLVRFDDGLAAQRVDLGGVLEDGSMELCSRAYVDLIDGRFEIVEHYPGRLRALNLPNRLIYDVLGVRAPTSPTRTRRYEPKPRSVRHEAVAQSQHVGAILTTGHPEAEVAHNPKHGVGQDDPVDFETLDDGSTIERFPDAPTRAQE